METEPEQSTAYVPPAVDESQDIEFWWGDVVLGILTLPLLFWAMMYAVTGGEKIFATRSARLKLYAVLLLLEAVAVGCVAYVVTR